MMSTDLRWWEILAVGVVALVATTAWCVAAERRDAANDRRRNANRAAWLDVGLTDAEIETLL